MSKETQDDPVIWVLGQPVVVAAEVWPSGRTPRAQVRLAGPVQPAWRAAMASGGLRLRFWCPPRGACVDLPAAYQASPSKLSTLGFIVDARDHTETMCQRPATPAAAARLPADLLDVVCFDAGARAAVLAQLSTLGIPVLQVACSKLRVRHGDAAALRALPGVKLVDAVRLPQLLSAEALRRVIGAWPPASPAAAKLQAWGLDGAGEVIAVADTGLDIGSPSAGLHADFAGRVRALVSLPMNASWSGFAEPRSDHAAGRGGGHGTLVAGLALGSGAASRGLHRGVAPAAELVFHAIEQEVHVLPQASAQLPSGYYLAGRSTCGSSIEPPPRWAPACTT